MPGPPCSSSTASFGLLPTRLVQTLKRPLGVSMVIILTPPVARRHGRRGCSNWPVARRCRWRNAASGNSTARRQARRRFMDTLRRHTTGTIGAAVEVRKLGRFWEGRSASAGRGRTDGGWRGGVGWASAHRLSAFPLHRHGGLKPTLRPPCSGCGSLARSLPLRAVAMVGRGRQITARLPSFVPCSSAGLHRMTAVGWPLAKSSGIFTVLLPSLPTLASAVPCDR